jgi:hypothetical protein
MVRRGLSYQLGSGKEVSVMFINITIQVTIKR